MAMEDVAGTAEKLAKDKATRDPPPAFQRRATQSIYSQVYTMNGREARDQRAEQRCMRATGIEKLGDKEYKKLLQEIDQMTQTLVNMQELIDKRMKEISERLEAEEKEKEAAEQCKTRSQDKPGTLKDTESVPARRLSPRKRKPDPEQEKDLRKKSDLETKDRPKKETDVDDASKNRKDRGAKWPKQSKTAAIPMIMDANDDDDLRILEDKGDKTYEPEEDEDDVIYPMDDDDDDFQEPPPRARKPTTKTTKPSKKPMKTTTRRVKESTKDADVNEETLSLFQRLVGPDFEIRASEEFEEDPKDKYGNPVEAAGFRATMKMLALDLKKAVKKRKNVEKTYMDMIRSTIEVAKAMKYPGATTVELNDRIPAIKDMKCNAWRKFLKGVTKMEPADVEMDDDEPENEDDLIIQGPILGKESTEAVAEAIHKLPQMLLADTKKQLKHLFEHTMQAHQHAAEASKCLKELHERLPLDFFLKIADSAVRPLVVLHIPRTEQIIEKLKETAVQNTQRKRRQGSTEVTDVMIARNLPQCGKWTAEEEYRPRKMIASIIYKYIREAMFKGKTVTQLVVDEFSLPKMTIHRQIYGKKYPGGGQTLEKLRKEDKKVEASGSGTTKIAVILKKAKTNTDTEPPSKKGKGLGKKSGKERSAKDIRGAATAEEEKQKREANKRKAMEEEEEEDLDRPTKAEIAASKPTSKTLFIH